MLFGIAVEPAISDRSGSWISPTFGDISRGASELGRRVALRVWQMQSCLTATVREACLMLTCGLPGAGKTTFARRLAAERCAVRLTKDEWLIALGSNPWDEPTRVKLERQLWELAHDLLRLGVSVVLDFGLWARTERDEFRTAARGLGVGVELHYLDVPTDELWRRIHARNEEPPWDGYPIQRSHLDQWAALFQAPDPAELALFDPPPRSD